MKRFIFAVIVGLGLFSFGSPSLTLAQAVTATSTSAVRDSIAEAVAYQVEHYPASQYRDIYKNFMQDYFGPGHILADTVKAVNYLRSELAEEGPFKGPLYEKTGYEGNFYRVNLSLIRDGVVPYGVFFNAFVESVQGIEPPAGEDWMEKWGLVDSVIREKGYTFANEDEDRETLMRQFAAGNFVAHHSRAYNESVHFHYRIISRRLFLERILPLISSNSELLIRRGPLLGDP